MNCSEAIEHLYTYLDEELTSEVKAEVRVHIEECEDCLGHFELERLFLRFVEARCRAQAAPAELRRKIFERVLLERELEA